MSDALERDLEAYEMRGEKMSERSEYMAAALALLEHAESNDLATVILTVKQHGPVGATSNVECLPGKEKRVYDALLWAAANLAKQAGHDD
jgi:hypothetical protein